MCFGESEGAGANVQKIGAWAARVGRGQHESRKASTSRAECGRVKKGRSVSGMIIGRLALCSETILFGPGYKKQGGERASSSLLLRA